MMNTQGRTIGATIAVAVACLWLSACPDPYTGTIVTAPRAIRVDVRNLLFQPYPNPIPSARGLWASKVNVTVTTDAGPFTGTVSSGAMASDGFGYTPLVVQNVSGELVSVAVTVETADAKSFQAELTDWTATEAYQGWTTFRNVVKFRLDVKTSEAGIEASKLVLEPCPRGGRSVRLAVDAGVTEAAYALTDRGKAGLLATAGYVCFQPGWLEHPSGLALNVYASLVDEDLAERYGLGSATSDAGSYMSDYWTNGWSATEIMTTGRSVAGKLLRLTPIRSNVSATKPEGEDDAYASVLLDYRDHVGEYLVIAAVLRQGELYAPSEVVCMKIE